MTDPLTLAIETSNPSAAAEGARPGVALARGRELIDTEGLRRDTRHDDELMPAIERLCQRSGVSPAELDRIAISIGPGGLTGLRIAVVTAATLSELCGAECIAVPTARVARAMCPAPDTLGVLLASKKDRGWLVTFDSEGERVIGDCDPARLEASEIDVLLADPHLPEVWSDAARASDISLAPLRLSAEACLRASWDIEPIAPSELRVLYPREPDAVTAWRKLHRF